MESAPTGCGMPLCIPWALTATETATGRRGRRPLRSCCLPIHWFVGAAHVRPAAVRRRSFAGSRRAGHARPLPHDDIKKAQKAAAMRFLHSCGFIYTLLCAHISVSYTHLDVYKRQTVQPVPAAAFSACPIWRLSKDVMGISFMGVSFPRCRFTVFL